MKRRLKKKSELNTPLANNKQVKRQYFLVHESFTNYCRITARDYGAERLWSLRRREQPKWVRGGDSV